MFNECKHLQIVVQSNINVLFIEEIFNHAIVLLFQLQAFNRIEK